MAIYEAQYVGSRILAWENYTSTATPLSAGNLNKIQATLEAIDTNAGNAINLLDQTKADKDEIANVVNSVQFNDQTGVFTFGQIGGTSITINTVLEKVPASFAYDTQTEKLVIVNTDGTIVQVDLSTVIQQTEFVDSDTVAWTINADGTMSASVKDGSITDAKIQQHYLALVTAQANAANASATNAAYQALLAKSYANGTSNLDDRPTENVDNSYYFSQQSKNSSEDSESWAVGQRNGTDIPSTDPAYENNAKYWAQVSEQMSGQSVFLGATSTANGFRGLVPDPLIADRNKVLKGDGTWGESEGTQQLQNDLITTQDNIADVEVSPAVAAHAVDEQIIYNNVLYTVMSAISIGDTLTVGTNIVESERIVEQLQPFTGATNQNAGDIGTVPAPSAGDEDKVLQGNGTWGKKLQIDVVIQNNTYGYIGADNTFIPFKSQADIDAAVSAAMVGNATAADVIQGKTFTNSTSSGLTGEIVDRGSATASVSVGSNDTNGLTYHRIPNGAYRTNAGTGYPEITTPYSTYGTAGTDDVLTGKTFTATAGFTKTGTMPSRSNGEAAVSTDRANGIRVFFPRGHYPNYATHDGQSYVTLTDAQVVNFANKQEKTVTPSTSAQTVTPDDGKLLSKVTVNAVSLSGNAGTGDVRSGKTFYKDSLTKQTGTLADYSGSGNMYVGVWGSGNQKQPAVRVTTITPKSQIGGSNASNAEYLEIAMPAGIWAWSWGNSSACLPTETKSVTPSTSAQTITPTDYNSNTKTPKYLKSVTVNAIPTQRSSSGQASGDKVWLYNNRIYFGFDYGWYPSGSSYGSMSNVCERYVNYSSVVGTLGITASTVRPGSTILGVAGTKESTTYTCGSNTGAASSNDMGDTNSYRYVNATNVYNKGSDDKKFNLSVSWQSTSGDASISSSTATRTFSGLATNCLYCVVLHMRSNTTDRIAEGNITISSGGTKKFAINSYVQSWHGGDSKDQSSAIFFKATSTSATVKITNCVSCFMDLVHIY